MARHEDTKLLGLRGLYIEAQRRNDAVAARCLPRRRPRPRRRWCGPGRRRSTIVAPPPTGPARLKRSNHESRARQERSIAASARSADRARACARRVDRDVRARALDAVKLAPDLVPAAALAGRRLAESGEARRAAKILNAAWQPIRTPTLPRLMRICDSAIQRARTARMGRSSPPRCRASSKARWPWRAPRSMRAICYRPRRAGALCLGADPARCHS